MKCKAFYDSIIGKIFIYADDIGLTGMYFEGQRFFDDKAFGEYFESNNEVIEMTKKWLDAYFCGNVPDFLPAVNMQGTDFQLAVWNILRKIPYGNTLTYSDIAKKIAIQRDIKRMSAQAVGAAVGHNKISLIIPCHRVIGSDGSLTGYAGGLERKKRLLLLENIDIVKY